MIAFKLYFRSCSLFALLIFCAASQLNAQSDSLNEVNAALYHHALAADGGTWIAENPLPTDDAEKLTFMMQFKINEVNGLEGTISMVTASGDTSVLWKIVEFIDRTEHTVHFIQYGPYGRADALAAFPTPDTRTCTFDLYPSYGETEKHKDIHTFQDEHTMLTKSFIIDKNDGSEMAMPDMVWQRVRG